MLNRYYIGLLIILLQVFGATAQKKGQAEAVEVKVPNWVSSRPSGGFKYIGIGVADKMRSTDYQMDAKKNDQ